MWFRRLQTKHSRNIIYMNVTRQATDDYGEEHILRFHPQVQANDGSYRKFNYSTFSCNLLNKKSISYVKAVRVILNHKSRGQ